MLAWQVMTSFQNGLFSALPFLAQWISKMIFAVVADAMKKRTRISHTKICKAFNTLGMLLWLVVSSSPWGPKGRTSARGLSLTIRYRDHRSISLFGRLCIHELRSSRLGHRSALVGQRRFLGPRARCHDSFGLFRSSLHGSCEWHLTIRCPGGVYCGSLYRRRSDQRRKC